MQLPSVAVIVPNFERTRELRHALDSVAHQTYRGEVRCYVVYRPREGIAQVLEGHPDMLAIPMEKRTDVHDLGVRRNLGLDRSTEDLVAILDDDDVWHPHKLELQVAALIENPDALAIATGYHRFDAEEPRWEGPEEGPLEDLTELDVARGAGAILTSSVVLRGDVARQVRFAHEPYFVEDFTAWLEVRRRGRFLKLNSNLVGYRMTPESLSRAKLDVHYAQALAVLAAHGRRHGFTPAVARALLEKSKMAVFHPDEAGDPEAIDILGKAFDRGWGRVLMRAVEAGWRSEHLVPLVQAISRGLGRRPPPTAS